MKILLTGSKGFIGSHIYNQLKGIYDIIGIDLFPETAADKNYHYIDLTNITLVDNFFNSIKNIDIIIHSAALAHKKGTDLSFNKYIKINFETTKNLIDMSNKYLTLKNFIFFSTISVYGEKIDKEIYYEADYTNPKSPYAVTKKMSEDFIIKNAKCNYTIFRFAPVYSKEFTLNIDRRTRIKNFIYKVGNGTNRLSLLNVKNIESVIQYLIDNPKLCNNDIFNLADKKIYLYNDLINYQINRLNSKTVIRIPFFFIYIIYLFGKLIKNNFIIENSIKLISNNVYDTSKIFSHCILNYALNDSSKIR